MQVIQTYVRQAAVASLSVNHTDSECIPHTAILGYRSPALCYIDEAVGVPLHTARQDTDEGESMEGCRGQLREFPRHNGQYKV